MRPEESDITLGILQQHGIKPRDQGGLGILGLPQHVLDLSEAPWEPGRWFGDLLNEAGYTENISIRGKDYKKAAQILANNGIGFPGNPLPTTQEESTY